MLILNLTKNDMLSESRPHNSQLLRKQSRVLGQVLVSNHSALSNKDLALVCTVRCCTLALMCTARCCTHCHCSIGCCCYMDVAIL